MTLPQIHHCAYPVCAGRPATAPGNSARQQRPATAPGNSVRQQRPATAPGDRRAAGSPRRPDRLADRHIADWHIPRRQIRRFAPGARLGVDPLDAIRA